MENMKNILCYGDSNTHGTKPIDFDMLDVDFIPSTYRYPEEKRWTTIMQKGLGDNYNIIVEGLNGRCTVFDDPVEGIHKNGSTYLLPCLESHAPLDLVILTLGTNDLKNRFSVTAFEVALGIGKIIDIIKKSGSGPDGSCPEILIVCPPPLGKLSHLSEILVGGQEKSLELDKNFKKVAKLNNCHYFNLGRIIKTSSKDGVHYDQEELVKIGENLALKVKEIFGQ
jgi:lysophospholipase L1-like esterase